MKTKSNVGAEFVSIILGAIGGAEVTAVSAHPGVFTASVLC